MNYTATVALSYLGPKMKRLVEFDILRGILLLMMSVDHSPSSLRRFTDQPRGFFSAAECFVFVSAFLAGMIFARVPKSSGLPLLARLRSTGPAVARSLPSQSNIATSKRPWSHETCLNHRRGHYGAIEEPIISFALAVSR